MPPGRDGQKPEFQIWGWVYIVTTALGSDYYYSASFFSLSAPGQWNVCDEKDTSSGSQFAATDKVPEREYKGPTMKVFGDPECEYHEAPVQGGELGLLNCKKWRQAKCYVPTMRQEDRSKMCDWFRGLQATLLIQCRWE
jgi:hypothetical protein